jgi:hypothetical protein
MIRAIMYTLAATMAAMALDNGADHLWGSCGWDVLLAVGGFYLGNKLEESHHD